jgi:hypothetical protein
VMIEPASSVSSIQNEYSITTTLQKHTQTNITICAFKAADHATCRPTH